ncbi:[acyl-carrier-protein] S-malonyltransferase [Candidatus Pantoea edessiphila]|uniref:Malonyl CoA-acyl carrier protein transacylase n=1 Tax=Candidatus Pantoea edessiphila TaxID=2044610 RepID=A0A2P5SYU0_9GAMM|nr:ACP S-malonyltransferase [Candidatus Pantoea edessiphila]MBK4775350.1 ACP S-malonyltransferase [Pantoea sp. Edef]PPI87517.1 [acyl-carrier-protein] S-malonyltransferase [Candidatus Pantoea edessiphila]
MTQLAFVFPGQGSQYVGMLNDFLEKYSIARQTFQEASHILGYDLLRLVNQGPCKHLHYTWKTQPAILTSSIAIYRIWQHEGGRAPILMAGHSLGEYSALVCAGAIEFTDAIKLVEFRGRIMQELTKTRIGAMHAIIGLDRTTIEKICKKTKENQIVSIANFNSQDQFVIAGDKEAVYRASNACKSLGAYVKHLMVGVPSHCMLMKSAAKQLENRLQKIKFMKPSISIINNVDVKIEDDEYAIRRALTRQMYSSVRWLEIIEYISKQGITILLEIGPGKILSRLNKRISKNLTSISINDTNSLMMALDKHK